MKTIELQIPEGKKAEWINGVLTLVDEQAKDDRTVTERIKTFQDAIYELGAEHPFIEQYVQIGEAYKGEDSIKDVVAYLKLRIICAALNEGWEPQFTTSEHRYFPWFYLYTKEEAGNLSASDKERIYRLPSIADYDGALCTNAVCDSLYSYSYTNYGSQLAFKTRELAIYAGKQFIDIWTDYIYKQ